MLDGAASAAGRPVLDVPGRPAPQVPQPRPGPLGQARDPDQQGPAGLAPARQRPGRLLEGDRRGDQQPGALRGHHQRRALPGLQAAPGAQAGARGAAPASTCAAATRCSWSTTPASRPPTRHGRGPRPGGAGPERRPAGQRVAAAGHHPGGPARDRGAERREGDRQPGDRRPHRRAPSTARRPSPARSCCRANRARWRSATSSSPPPSGDGLTACPTCRVSGYAAPMSPPGPGLADPDGSASGAGFASRRRRPARPRPRSPRSNRSRRRASPCPEADRRALEAELSTLAQELKRLRERPESAALLPDVEIFYRAVDGAFRYGEFFKEDEIPKARQLLAIGRERARAAASGKSPWLEQPGPTALGYVSARGRLGAALRPDPARRLPPARRPPLAPGRLVPRPGRDAVRGELPGAAGGGAQAGRVRRAERAAAAALRPLLQRQQAGRRGRLPRGAGRRAAPLLRRRGPHRDPRLLAGRPQRLAPRRALRLALGGGGPGRRVLRVAGVPEGVRQGEARAELVGGEAVAAVRRPGLRRELPQRAAGRLQRREGQAEAGRRPDGRRAVEGGHRSGARDRARHRPQLPPRGQGAHQPAGGHAGGAGPRSPAPPGDAGDPDAEVPAPGLAADRRPGGALDPRPHRRRAAGGRPHQPAHARA